MDKRLWIISLIIFIDVLGTGLILPLLPFFAQNLGAGPLAIGLFISTLPFFSILAGPPLGILSDRYGRRPVLLFSIAGTVLGFATLGLAQTLPVLFLSRIIAGISAGNMSTAKAAIADITTREERVHRLGLTFAAESLGLILGPVIGGLFSQYGFTVAAFIATAIALVCFFLTLFFFKETHPIESGQQPVVSSVELARGQFEEKNARPAKPVGLRLGVFHIDEVMRAVRNPRTQGLVLAVFIIQLLIMMMWGTLALYAQHFYGFGGKEMGYVSAFAATVGITAQLLLLKPIIRKLGEKRTIIAALSMMSVGLALLALSRSVVVLLVGVGLMAACFNVAMPTVVGVASRRSHESEQGSLMGTTTSAINLASLTGPVFGNAIFTISMRGSYWVASAIGLVAVAVTARNIKAESEPVLEY